MREKHLAFVYRLRHLVLGPRGRQGHRNDYKNVNIEGVSGEGYFDTFLFQGLDQAEPV